MPCSRSSSGRTGPVATALTLLPVGAGQPLKGSGAGPGVELCGTWTALQLFPVHREARKFQPSHPGFHLPFGVHNLPGRVALPGRAFSNPGKASKSRILPVAPKASWPMSTSFPLTLCVTHQPHCAYFSFSSSAHSLLPVGSEPAVPFAWKVRSAAFPSFLLFILPT